MCRPESRPPPPGIQEYSSTVTSELHAQAERTKPSLPGSPEKMSWHSPLPLTVLFGLDRIAFTLAGCGKHMGLGRTASSARRCCGWRWASAVP